MYFEYDNITDLEQDEAVAHTENIKQAQDLGDYDYASGTVRWSDTTNALDDDGKFVMQKPPSRITDKIATMKNTGERSARVRAPDDTIRFSITPRRR